VAIGTVSNVLNNPDLVSEQTRVKVEAAIAQLGFVRNSAARALAARRTDTVGLILIDIGNSLFVDIARGAESAAGQAQLKLLLANSDSTRDKQDNYLELFDQARVAGVLLTPLEEPLDVAHAVLGHGRPVVLVIATSPDPLTCSVMVNEELGGYLAATHLSTEERAGSSSSLAVRICDSSGGAWQASSGPLPKEAPVSEW
jgi:LacI family transcriptional regulator